MKHELHSDEEKQVILMRIRGEFTLEEAIESIKKKEALTKDKDSILVLTDMREAPPMLDREVRESTKDISKKLNITKTAMVITNPAVRIASKIVVSAMESADKSGFFKTEEEALEWLRDGK